MLQHTFFAKRNWLLAVAALCFLLGLWLLLINRPVQTSSKRALGRVQVAFGESLVSPSRGALEKIEKARPLHRWDELQTREASEALVSFESGEEIRVLEKSRVLFDLEAGRPLIVVLQGDIWIEREIESGQVLISREGSRKTLMEERLAKKSAVSKTSRQARTSSKASSKNNDLGLMNRSAGQRLTPDVIQSTLKAQRQSFFKCYTQLLQKTPGVTGEASVSFTIERTGRVSLAEISSSSLKDSAFRNCLLDTVRRVEFKSFPGDPISALFPLRFD